VFDQTRGVAFGTYASFRVRGCIIDGFLRRQVPVMQPMEAESLADNEPVDPTPSIEDTLMRTTRCTAENGS
jgi:hypothetical protein